MWSKKFTLKKLILGGYLFAQRVYCEDESNSIYGTWSSKSNQVFTGPGFYDPVDELLIEPSLPGLSYSFTEDGWYEEATYQVSGNPRNPTCPMASLIYQHGTYNISENGTLVLNLLKLTVDNYSATHAMMTEFRLILDITKQKLSRNMP